MPSSDAGIRTWACLAFRLNHFSLASWVRLLVGLLRLSLRQTDTQDGRKVTLSQTDFPT
jgi:hypothetical protein